MTSVLELKKIRELSNLERNVYIGPGVVNEEVYSSLSIDKKVETVLSLLGVDDETKKKYFESIRNFDRGRFNQERLALIRAATEEMERLEDNDKISNKREQVLYLDDRKTFVKIGRCFIYKTITPKNRFGIEDYERESFDMLVFGMHGVKSSRLVSRVNGDSYDRYDVVIPFNNSPRKTVISTDGLREMGKKYTLTENGIGIIFDYIVIPEVKNLSKSIDEENKLTN